MHLDSEKHVDRVSRLVRVRLMDGTEVKGRIFLRQGDRVVDLLNDTRIFIPFEDEETSIIVLNKTAIAGIFDDLDQRTGMRERIKTLTPDDQA
jgi:hypothetical protein